MKTAVVIGSTGLIGSLLLEKLAQDTTYTQIIAVLRKKPPEKNSIFANPRIRCVQFDFVSWQELELQVRSFVGTSSVSFFCCLGTTIGQAGSEAAFKKVDHDYIIEFAKLAQLCRADILLVVSALGADANSTVFYNRVKGETELGVQQFFKSKLHFLRPSLLLGDRTDFRFAERIAILLSPIYSPLLIGRMKSYKPVKASDVALAMLAIAAKRSSASTIVSNEEIQKIALSK